MTERFEQHRFAVPAGATEVVLVRHGASAAAVPDEPFPLLDGHGDPPLSPEGERQAALVAARLAAEGPPDGLFVTPLARTRQTAAPLAAALGLEPVVVPDLREVHLGEWEAGEYRIRVARRDPAALRALAEERWDALPGGEAMDAFAERVARGLDEVVARGRAGGRLPRGGRRPRRRDRRALPPGHGEPPVRLRPRREHVAHPARRPARRRAAAALVQRHGAPRLRR